MAAPSAKQLDYIASLMGIRDNAYHSMAYAEIGKDMRMSSSAAAKRATAKDASETIDRLKQKSNPSRRSVALKNFSGTITRNSNGTVTVKGRGKVAKKRAK